MPRATPTVTSVTGDVDHFAEALTLLTNEVYASLEAAWGASLDAEARGELALILGRYLTLHHAEANAASTDLALTRLNIIRDKVNQLNTALTYSPMQGAASDAEAEALQRLEEALANIRARTGCRPISLAEIWHANQQVAEASVIARVAIQNIPSSSMFLHGDAWNNLVQEMTTFGKSRGRPTTSRKDVDKTGNQSAFTIVLYRLMGALPSTHHRQSESATATGIYQARSAARRER